MKDDVVIHLADKDGHSEQLGLATNTVGGTTVMVAPGEHVTVGGRTSCGIDGPATVILTKPLPKRAGVRDTFNKVKLTSRR